MNRVTGKAPNRNRSAGYRQLCCYLLACWLLAACGAGLPAALGGPTPVPTAPVDPYQTAVAGAEAAGDQTALANALYERGNLWLDQGDPAAAIADYDRAVALDPRNARAFNNRGLAYSAMGDAEAALADYSTAIQLDPNYVRAYTNRILLLEQRNDLAALAADYATLANLVPERAADYHYRAGVALAGLRERDAAQQAFDAALQANPQQVDALYERGLLHFASGRPADAISDFDAALRLSPRAANAYYARGLAYSAIGEHQQARADFTQALVLRPDDPAALLGRASAAYTMNDLATAKADLEQAMSLPLTNVQQQATDTLQQQLQAAQQAQP